MPGGKVVRQSRCHFPSQTLQIRMQCCPGTATSKAAAFLLFFFLFFNPRPVSKLSRSKFSCWNTALLHFLSTCLHRDSWGPSSSGFVVVSPQQLRVTHCGCVVTADGTGAEQQAVLRLCSECTPVELEHSETCVLHSIRKSHSWPDPDLH